MTSSPLAVGLLWLLAGAFGAGAELVEPSELARMSGRTLEEVGRALDTVVRDRAGYVHAILDPDGRVLAITGVTPAGCRAIRSFGRASSVLTGPRAGGAARRGWRILATVVAGVVVRTVAEYLPVRD